MLKLFIHKSYICNHILICSAGVLSLYLYSQSTIWWLFHICFLFWKVVFPLHARFSGNVKYIHITCVLLGIVLPIIPIITSMADFAVDLQKQNENSTSQFRNNLFLSRGLGFEVNRFPPTRCSSTRHDAIFYSYVLTSDIMLGCGCTLLLIAVWSIHKLYKRKREQVTKYNIYVELTI